jgi:hypothetical protein
MPQGIIRQKLRRNYAEITKLLICYEKSYDMDFYSSILGIYYLGAA